MNYFIGVDIGSQSSKGVLVTQEGTVVAQHIIPHKMSMPQQGHFEHDADNIWWKEFCAISKMLIAQSNIDSNDIKAVGHSAILSSVCFLDKQDKPLRPGILYGIDTRAIKEQEELTEIIGEEHILSTGGTSLSSQSVAPKILWVKKHEPQVWQNTRKIVSANSYITYKLTGNFVENTYDAVGHTGLYNIFTKQWIREYIPHVLTYEYLPDLISPTKIAGYIHAEGAHESGLAEGTAVLPGVSDAAAESLAAGVSELHEMMLMLGTSSFFILYTDSLYTSSKFWGTSFLQENEYVLTGGTSNCGSAITWFIEQFCQKEQDVYTKLISEINNKSITQNSPLIIPYFAGERTPIHDPEAKAIFFQVSLNHTRGDLFLALLEGIAYTIKSNIEALQEFSPIGKIYAIGGVTQNFTLMQLISDICGIDIVIPDGSIGASYGDAYMAARYALDNNISIKDWVPIKHIVKPDYTLKSLYEKRYNIYNSVYSSTRRFITSHS